MGNLTLRTSVYCLYNLLLINHILRDRLLTCRYLATRKHHHNMEIYMNCGKRTSPANMSSVTDGCLQLGSIACGWLMTDGSPPPRRSLFV